jgi:hypothetical protein
MIGRPAEEKSMKKVEEGGRRLKKLKKIKK